VLGAEIVSCESFDLASVFRQQSPDEDVAEFPFCRLAIRTLLQVENFYRSDRPDLIIYDTVAFAGRILANRLQTPSVQMTPDMVLHRHLFTEQVSDAEFRTQLLAAEKQSDTFFSRYGIRGNLLFHREGLNIFFLPETFQPERVRSADCISAGRCHGEQPLRGHWSAARANGRPIVLVSSSTSYLRGPEYFRMCVESLRELELHTVLAIADADDPAALGRLPSHFEVIQRTSHLSILPYASVFVCMGSAGSAAEAAFNGVPVIVRDEGIPELAWYCNAIAKTGLGIHLSKSETTIDSLRDATLRALSDGDFRSRVRNLQQRLLGEAGSEQVVDRIEQYAQTHV